MLSGVPCVLTFTASNAWLALLTVLAWGAVAFGNVPGLQVYVVQRAQRDVPDAVDVASGLNIAAFNVGIAAGAWAGGLIVTQLGLMATPWIGALVVLGALGLTTLAGWLDRQGWRTEFSGGSIAGVGPTGLQRAVLTAAKKAMPF
jgi:DHA1 family inner membrane transport protein